MRVTRLVTVLGVGALCARCLVVSPLDDVNDGVGTGGVAGSSGTDAAGGSAGAAGASGSAGGGCTAHLDCVEQTQGEPARCVKGKCEAIKTNDCWCVPNVPGEVWKDPNSILIGAFAPLAANAEGCGSDTASLNYRLALEEINSDAIGGLPGPGATRRPIAVVLCTNGEQEASPATRLEKVLAASKHLTQTLKVPAVLPYVDTGDLQKAFATYGLPEGVFFFTPSGATETLETENDDNLLWHMLGRAGDVAATYAAVVEKLEPIAPTVLGEPGPTKVLLLTQSGAAQSELKQAIEAVLEFNGVGWVQNGANYKLVTVDPADTDKAAADIVSFRPHIVLSVLDSIFNVVHFKADQGWRPYYVLSPFQVNALDKVMTDIENTNLEKPELQGKLQERYVGVNVAGSEDTVMRDAYEARLETRFPGANSVAENIYDSVYYLAFAMFAGGKLDSVFGGDLPGGMDDILVQGPAFDVGPADVIDAFLELEKGDGTGTVRLFGTMGPPQYFDRNTGVRHNTGALYCFQKNPATLQLASRFHVGHYDDKANPPHLRRAQVWQGAQTLPCLDWMNLPDS